MEHKVGNRKLQRTTAHRLAMLRNMVTSLIEHERIVTTVPKAKEARKMAEKVITLGKKGGLNNVRMAQKIVKDRALLQKIFGELKTRYATRAGGYTRLMRGGFRKGDAADIAILELMDRPEAAPAAADAKSDEKKPEEKKAKTEEKKP